MGGVDICAAMRKAFVTDYSDSLAKGDPAPLENPAYAHLIRELHECWVVAREQFWVIATSSLNKDIDRGLDYGALASEAYERLAYCDSGARKIEYDNFVTTWDHNDKTVRDFLARLRYIRANASHYRVLLSAYLGRLPSAIEACRYAYSDMFQQHCDNISLLYYMMFYVELLLRSPDHLRALPAVMRTIAILSEDFRADEPQLSEWIKSVSNRVKALTALSPPS